MAVSVIPNIYPYTAYDDSDRSISYKKIGRTCTAFVNNTTIALQSKTWRKLEGVIPSGFRPISDISTVCFCGNDRNIPCIVGISTTGDIQFYNTSNSDASGVYGASITYLS